MDLNLSICHMRSTALVFILSLVTQPAFSMTASEVFEIASKSTVVVMKHDGKGKALGFGSGVVLPGGDIATNCHVVEGAVKISVRSSGKDYPAIMRYSDWERDVCSVSVAGNMQNTPITMGSTKRLMTGKPVYAIGSPQGLELTLSDGIVSSLREVEGGNYIQTTAAISPGSSGGGLYDENGALVGLTTFYLAEGQNLNFAVPVEWITDLPKRHNSNHLTVESNTSWMNKAIELESLKAWSLLINHCLRWTKSYPNDANAWHGLGFAYSSLGQYTKAIESYQLAIRINPEHSRAWYNLGIAYGFSGLHAKSLESYQQAIRFNSDNSSAWYNLGIAYNDSGQYSKAIESYQQAIRINPEKATAWTNLGNTYNHSGQYLNAIESFQQAIRINPEDELTWFNLGNIYVDFGQPAKAIESFKQAIRINPEYANAWSNLGLCYHTSGQYAKAIESYQKAIQFNSEHPKAWLGLGNAYIYSSQHTKAIESFQQAIRVNPQDDSAWYNLGWCYRTSGQSNKVTEVYKRLKALNSAKADDFFNKFVMP